MSALPKDMQLESEEIEDLAVSEEALRLARDAVQKFPGCFWFWVKSPAIETAADVKEVQRNLRLNGGRDAWEMAARIAKCR